MLPILENLGLRVLGEFPYRLRHANGREFWIHDFAFIAAEGVNLDIQQLNDTLQDAFVHIVHGDAENDAFNRLVLTAGLPWRDVALLRAYARYMKQIRLGFDLGYIASTLNNHTDIARELTRLFKTRFYLARKLTAEDLEDKQQRHVAPWQAGGEYQAVERIVLGVAMHDVHEGVLQGVVELLDIQVHAFGGNERKIMDPELTAIGVLPRIRLWSICSTSTA